VLECWSLCLKRHEAPKYDVARARVLGFLRHNIPVNAYRVPSVDQLKEFMKYLPPGAKAIVHCGTGNGRAGTFGAAYWVGKGKTDSEAIARVRKARPHARVGYFLHSHSPRCVTPLSLAKTRSDGVDRRVIRDARNRWPCWM
jgi:rhodanese/phosphatase family protein